MTEFEKIVVGRNSIPSLIVSAVLMILIPVVFFLCWRRKHKEQTTIAWLFAGAAGFMISARVLELGALSLYSLGSSRFPVHQRKHRRLCAVRCHYGGRI